ncbi:MAG TPA: S46 family peptidase, partial [Pyrinomonadaceae bacterium]|nr:S46 family peptidase [Pyrinomonadaceae bacterium]
MKKSVSFLLITLLLLAVTSFVRADEGMWTFDNPPRKEWKERYNFDPPASWLEHLRLSSVRFPGASGSFVSPNGL